MTDSRQLDRALEAFLEMGTDELADRVLDAALLQIDHTQQRRRSTAFGRIITMNTQLRLAAAAVIGVIAIGGAIYALSPRLGVGSATPSPALSARPLPSAVASLFRITGSPAKDRTVRGITVGLLDGRVLTAGGGATDSDTADLYDPASGSWSATGSMHDARSYPVAVRVKDGRVLVAGGNGRTTGDLASVELYDGAAGTWSTVAPMHDARQQAFAALLADGRVLVGGGISGQNVLTKTEIFDPTSGAWTPTGDLVMGRAGPLSATLLSDGRVLVTGGLADDNKSAELFDPNAGTWSATGSLSGPRGDEQASVLLANGTVLSIGGHRDIGDGGQTTGEAFDPKTGKWVLGPALAGQHSDVQAVVTLADGRVFLASATPTGENAVAEIYDQATATWSLIGALNGMRFVQSATLLPNGSVLVVGSSTTVFSAATSGTPSAELFDPASIR